MGLEHEPLRFYNRTEPKNSLAALLECWDALAESKNRVHDTLLSACSIVSADTKEATIRMLVERVQELQTRASIVAVSEAVALGVRPATEVMIAPDPHDIKRARDRAKKAGEWWTHPVTGVEEAPLCIRVLYEIVNNDGKKVVVDGEDPSGSTKCSTCSGTGSTECDHDEEHDCEDCNGTGWESLGELGAPLGWFICYGQGISKRLGYASDNQAQRVMKTMLEMYPTREALDKLFAPRPVPA